MQLDVRYVQYLKEHHLHVYLTDLLRLLGGSAAADASRLASNYLCAVAYGQHVQGREFEFIAAAPWNRLTFLNACKDVLQRVASHIEAFTLQDMHSLMLMMCSDVPLRVTRSAFKAATPLLPSGSAVPHLSGDVAKLAFPRVWSSLEVTFLYENYLLELRHVAFEGKSHMLKGAEDVDACIEAVEATVTMSGWPSIPQPVLQGVMQQFADSSDQGNKRFHFDALVRGLCESADMREHVDVTTAAARNKQQQAPAALAQAVRALETDPLHDTANLVRSSFSSGLTTSLLGIVDVCVESEV
ncbi:TPA: hypothetical protein ACH3X3_003133 [Trebouxia sp. C0006]